MFTIIDILLVILHPAASNYYIPIAIPLLLLTIMTLIEIGYILIERKIIIKIRTSANQINDNEYFELYSELRQKAVKYKNEIYDITPERRNLTKILKELESAFDTTVKKDNDKYEIHIKSVNSNGDVKETILTPDNCIENKNITEPMIRISEDYDIILLIPYEP